jgi:hypothetical protein
MFHVISPIIIVYVKVIHKDLIKVVFPIIIEHLVNCFRKCASGIFHAKWHDILIKQTIFHDSIVFVMSSNAIIIYQNLDYKSSALKNSDFPSWLITSRWLQGRVVHFLHHNAIFCKMPCIYMLLKHIVKLKIGQICD